MTHPVVMDRCDWQVIYDWPVKFCRNKSISRRLVEINGENCDIVDLVSVFCIGFFFNPKGKSVNYFQQKLQTFSLQWLVLNKSGLFGYYR